MVETQIPTSQPANPAPAAQPASPAPAPVEVYTIPVAVPGDLMSQLVALSNSRNIAISTLCASLIRQSANAQNLSDGIVSDLSEPAQDIIRTVSLEATLEALRIYNVPKVATVEGPAPADEPIVSTTDIVFSTTSDVKDLVAQINAVRATKGLASIEKSICELLLHYGISLGDYQICEKLTGLSLAKYKAVLKTMALAERDANAIPSNVIEQPSIFKSFTIVETPVGIPEPETA